MIKLKSRIEGGASFVYNSVPSGRIAMTFVLHLDVGLLISYLLPSLLRPPCMRLEVVVGS